MRPCSNDWQTLQIVHEQNVQNVDECVFMIDCIQHITGTCSTTPVTSEPTKSSKLVADCLV